MGDVILRTFNATATYVDAKLKLFCSDSLSVFTAQYRSVLLFARYWVRVLTVSLTNLIEICVVFLSLLRRKKLRCIQVPLVKHHRMKGTEGNATHS
jgi:hypothetical protein